MNIWIMINFAKYDTNEALCSWSSVWIIWYMNQLSRFRLLIATIYSYNFIYISVIYAYSTPCACIDDNIDIHNTHGVYIVYFEYCEFNVFSKRRFKYFTYFCISLNFKWLYVIHAQANIYKSLRYSEYYKWQNKHKI